MLNKTSVGQDALIYIVDIGNKKVLDIVEYRHYKARDAKKYSFLTNNNINALYHEGLRRHNIV